MTTSDYAKTSAAVHRAADLAALAATATSPESLVDFLERAVAALDGTGAGDHDLTRCPAFARFSALVRGPVNVRLEELATEDRRDRAAELHTRTSALAASLATALAERS